MEGNYLDGAIYKNIEDSGELRICSIHVLVLAQGPWSLIIAGMQHEACKGCISSQGP